MKGGEKVKKFSGVFWYLYGVLGLGAAVMLMTSSPVMAVNVWDPIVTAADVDGLSTAQIAILAAVILIPLGFAAYKVIRHALGMVR